MSTTTDHDSATAKMPTTWLWLLELTGSAPAPLRWVDGSPDLDPAAHTLLRTRHRALADKKTGAAADALDELRAQGIAVRDRDGAHQRRRERGGEWVTCLKAVRASLS